MTAAPGPPRLLGLRIDVDTHDGMKLGVPRLLEVLAGRGVRGTFYLAMGPDRSGLAVLNLLRPGFLAKMRRTGAARVYGLRTILSGTLLPARPVALAFPQIGRRIRAEGHETGVHAWDHRRWQDRLPRFSAAEVAGELGRAGEAYAAVFGEPAVTYAAPAWLSSAASLLFQETLGLAFASDCRGSEPFVPVVRGRELRTPQVPATLPTLDEALGDTHEEAGAYFDTMLEGAAAAACPVLTVHAELEGGPYADAFDAFLGRAAAAGVAVVPLGALLEARLATGAPLPRCGLHYAPVPGRHGVLSTQDTPRA